jgi:aminoglycoside phosphotransferase (APT) family kinase protein
LQERLRRRRAVAASDVPGSVEALTNDWWTAVLGAGTPGAAVTAFRVIGGSSGTHARHRFELTWNQTGLDAGLPKAVFTKSLPTLVNRMIGGYNGTAHAEGRFYLQIRPQLDIEAPLGYHAAFEPESLAAINVLEDIATTRGATFCDYRTAVDRNMAEGMVDLLAHLHGTTWNHPDLTNQWRWVANFADWYSVGARKMQTRKYTAQAMQRAAPVIPAAVLANRERLWPAVEASAQIHRQPAPRCLLHSDVHIGNWYRHADGRVGLYDWQCLTQGHFARDLAYALSTALTPQDRRAWERGLIERYLTVLAEHNVQLPSFDVAWHAYRTQMMHALWMWTITLCHSPFLPAMQTEDTSMAMIERITAAMADLGSIDAALSPVSA